MSVLNTDTCWAPRHTGLQSEVSAPQIIPHQTNSRSSKEHKNLYKKPDNYFSISDQLQSNKQFKQ